MIIPSPLRIVALGIAAGALLGGPALAQSLPYGDPGDEAEAVPAKAENPRERRGRGDGRPGRLHLDAYIEAAQMVDIELSPGDETLTYSVLAAGVDANVSGRNNAASVSLRYERRFGYGRAEDSDTISGVGRASLAVVPRKLQVEAGVLAERTRIESNGGAVLGAFDRGDTVTQVYSMYAGPSLNTHLGSAKVDAHYRIGYTKVTAPDLPVVAPGADPVDVFDHSTIHDAGVHIGTRPHQALPVGIGAGAGFYQEDISNLDQRVRDVHARADLVVPVTQSLAVVGGVGYEDVEVSSRDALRDASGDPVIGGDGRLITDPASPRVIAYETSGLIWDVGVMWRPSPRTSLEAHVGRRYGSTSYYGTFGWQATRRQSVNVAVYDQVAGFGGQVNRALAALPTEFTAVRNPLTGGIGGCVVSLEAGSCLGGALGSIRSATFRARGVAATWGVDSGRLQFGVGAGYDQRKFIAAPGTVLASANGVIDENYWLTAYLNGQLDRRSSFATSIYANWFQSGFASTGDGTAFGATAAYNRLLTGRLSATLAVGLDGVSREIEDDTWTASALAGVRYTF
jgi:hypothetical protein